MGPGRGWLGSTARKARAQCPAARSSRKLFMLSSWSASPRSCSVLLFTVASVDRALSAVRRDSGRSPALGFALTLCLSFPPTSALSR